MNRSLATFFKTLWLTMLAVFVASSLYEGYLVLPGFHGHSLFSVLQRILVFLLPIVTLYAFQRGPRTGWVPLTFLAGWLFVVGITYYLVSPPIYYDQYYVWSQIGGFLLVLALWNMARNPRWFQWAFSGSILLFLIATAIVSLIEIHTGHHLAQSRSGGAHPSRIPTAFYFDPNNLGAAIALSLPFLVLMGFLWKNRWVGLLSGGLALVLLYVLYKTGSRGGELALVLDLMALPLVLPKPYNRYAVLGMATVFLSLVALTVVLGTLPHNQPLPFALKKIQHLAHLVSLGQHRSVQHGPGSLTIRWALMQSGLHALSQHPWGLGPRGAERYYLYWVHHPSPFNTYGVIDAHNMWLENAMDFGWEGLALYVLFYLSAWIPLYRLRNHSDRLVRYLSWAGFSSLAGFLVGSLSPSSVMIGFDLMWVVYGGAVSANLLAARSRTRFRFAKHLH